MLQEQFNYVEEAIQALVQSRTCDCELAGLEPAMALARDTMANAMPIFEAQLRGEQPPAHEAELAYFALVIVATIIEKENVLAWQEPEEIDVALHLLGCLLRSIALHLESRASAFQRAMFDEHGHVRVTAH